MFLFDVVFYASSDAIGYMVFLFLVLFLDSFS